MLSPRRTRSYIFFYVRIVFYAATNRQDESTEWSDKMLRAVVLTLALCASANAEDLPDEISTFTGMCSHCLKKLRRIYRKEGG